MSEAKKQKLHEVAVRMIAVTMTESMLLAHNRAKLETLCQLLAEGEIAAKDLPKLIEQLEEIERKKDGSPRALKVLIAELKSNLEEGENE